MRIPNMCLILKLDNGKMVSIADKQTDRRTHPVPYSNIDIQHRKLWTPDKFVEKKLK